MTPKVLVLRTAGTNCEVETAHAFAVAGAEPVILHINALRSEPARLREVQMLAIPGGFSYGDDVASGRIFANELMSALRDELLSFIDRGGYAIGICNGFQVLVKAGLLPRLDGEARQQATLTHNTSGRYTDRWVRLEPRPGRCAWIPDDEPVELPVAHAEGRFMADDAVLARLEAAGQVPIRYHADDNFNGSAGRVAGLCDPTGRVFGLMPHPERFLRWENHPCWTRLPRQREGQGTRFFRAAVRHAQES
jgi:phosphoribosylformylglycinamidine synthase